MTAIVAALIAAIASIVVAFLSVSNSKKITETHKQVTVNSHSSDTPTVLDLIAEVRDAQQSTNRLIAHHLEWHLEKDR